MVVDEPRPLIARKYGRSFVPCCPASVTSLSHKEIGKVNIDCRLRLSKSKWGVLGANPNPGGILYMDINFDQPADCRLSTATVVVTLEEYHSHAGGSLRATDQYGPKKLMGELCKVPVTKNYYFAPHVDALGVGAGGVGIDKTKTKFESSRWTFTGQLLLANDKLNRPYETVYRRLKWELTENELESRVLHSNLFHTGFTIEHEHRPFYLKIEIQGKLRKTKDRIMNRFRFPPSGQKEDGISWTLIDPGRPGQSKRSLDALAEGLSRAMEMENFQTIPVQVPETLSVSFTEADKQPGIEPSSSILHSFPKINDQTPASETPLNPKPQLQSSPSSYHHTIHPNIDIFATFDDKFHKPQKGDNVTPSKEWSESTTSSRSSSLTRSRSISTALSSAISNTTANPTAVSDKGHTAMQSNEMQDLLSRLSKSFPLFCWCIFRLLKFVDWLQMMLKTSQEKPQLLEDEHRKGRSSHTTLPEVTGKKECKGKDVIGIM
ncbi:hypothetical protein ACMFMG_004667 [Clarireedia jacksonii]